VPSVKRIGPYRLYFYSEEGDEPPHVHIQRERATAKFWLQPVRLARSRRFADHELLKIEKLVEENEEEIWETWHEHFGH
jgi:hypothetical protein